MKGMVSAMGLVIILLAFSGCLDDPDIILVRGTGADSNLSFLDLNDTPNTYVGDANELVSVNSTGTGLVFIPRGDLNSAFCAKVGDCNISNNSATIPTLTLNNNAAGDVPYLRFMQNATVHMVFTTIVGFPFWACSPTTTFCGFGSSDLSAFFAIGGAGIGSALTDPNGFDISAPTNVLSTFHVTGTTDLDSNVNIDQNLNVHGLRAVFDSNVNALDLNIGRFAYVQNLQSKTFIRADSNIFTSANLHIRDQNVIYSDLNVLHFYSQDINNGYIFHGWRTLPGDQKLVSINVDVNKFTGFYIHNLPTTSAAFANMIYDTTNEKVYYRSSSPALKTNIQLWSPNTNRFDDLNLYTWTDKLTNQPGAGYLATEVCSFYPEICFTNPDGNINYDATTFSFLAIKELKERRKEDVKQAQLIVDLNAQNVLLRNIICTSGVPALTLGCINAGLGTTSVP